MQYYLELNPRIDGVYFESAAWPDASEQLEAIAKRLGIPSHFELFSFAAQNDLCAPEHQETEVPWHEPQVGIDWLDAVTAQIQSDPTSVPNPVGVLSDIAECKIALQRASANGSKWHFAMDI